MNLISTAILGCRRQRQEPVTQVTQRFIQHICARESFSKNLGKDFLVAACKWQAAKKQVLATRSVVRVERWKGCLVRRALHEPPGHGFFEPWLRQQDAIESDLHGIVAEDALRMISVGL